jgi:hypothetical protein
MRSGSGRSRTPHCSSRARTTARSAANIIRSFEAELSFYGQVFGFTRADPIDPLEIPFLDAARV